MFKKLFIILFFLIYATTSYALYGIKLPVSNSTITPGTDNTYAQGAEKVVAPKVDSVAGLMLLYTANSTDTTGSGFLGPDTAAGNVYYKLPTGIAAATNYYISFDWDATLGVRLYIDGVQQTLTEAGTFTPLASTTANGYVTISATYDVAGNEVGRVMDQTIISNDRTRDIYGIRMNTSF